MPRADLSTFLATPGPAALRQPPHGGTRGQHLGCARSASARREDSRVRHALDGRRRDPRGWMSPRVAAEIRAAAGGSDRVERAGPEPIRDVLARPWCAWCEIQIVGEHAVLADGSKVCIRCAEAGE